MWHEVFLLESPGGYHVTNHITVLGQGLCTKLFMYCVGIQWVFLLMLLSSPYQYLNSQLGSCHGP